MKRYKKIEFKNFYKGSSEKFFNPRGRFFDSKSIIPLSEKNDIISIFDRKIKYTIDDKYLENFDTSIYDTENLIIGPQGDLFYMLYDTITGTNVLYKNGTQIKDFGTSATDGNIALYVYNGRIICVYVDDDAGPIMKLSYSDDNGDTWTTVDRDDIADTYPPRNVIIVAGILYCIWDDNLYKSTDGVNYTLVSNQPSNGIKGLVYCSGFFYLLTTDNSYSKLILVKFSEKSGEYDIISKPFMMDANGWSHLFTFGDENVYYIRISDKVSSSGKYNTFEIVRFDGISNNIVHSISIDPDEEIYEVNIINTFDQFSIIAVRYGTSDEIKNYIFYKNESIFSLNNFLEDYFGASFSNNIVMLRATFDQKLYFLVTDQTSGSEKTYIFEEDLNKYLSDPYFITSIKRFDTEIAPKQLILKHNPLPTNVKINIYLAEDADAFNFNFGSILMTSSTDDSIVKNYDFPRSSKFTSFSIKVKISSESGDLTAFPENIELVLLYKPFGLEISK